MPGASGSSGAATIAKAACVCVASVTALAALAWLAWPRRRKASKEEVLVVLKLLREECAAACADVSATVVGAKLPAAARRPAATALPGTGADGRPSPQAEMADKLQQAIGQPLVLTAALQEAAARAASELPGGGSAEDLEAELERFAEDPEVQGVTGEIRAMHQACLEGRTATAPKSAAKELWAPDEALEMLRTLGQAKAHALHAVAAAAGGGVEGARQMGAEVLRACAWAEDEAWKRCWPGDAARRSCFPAALEWLAAGSRRFRERRAGVERELSALAAKATAGKALQ